MILLTAETFLLAVAQAAVQTPTVESVSAPPAAAPPSSGVAATFAGGEGFILQTILVLVVVVLLAVLVVRFGVRRVVAGPEWRGGPNLKVIERLSLEPRRSLILVRAGEKYLLLAAGESGVSLLREIPPHEVVTPIETGLGPLKTIWQRMTGGPGAAGGAP